MTLNQSIWLAAIFAVLGFLSFVFSPALIFGFNVVSIAWSHSVLVLCVDRQLNQVKSWRAA